MPSNEMNETGSQSDLDAQRMPSLSLARLGSFALIKMRVMKVKW